VNGLSPEKIVISQGETLPFADASFDIVYSANVIEHTNDPRQVLCESLRVLRPGGVLHFEMPNFTSYFEGHYFVMMPPLLHKTMLPWWVKTVFRRDPAFARTLRTEINPVWLRRTLRDLGTNQHLRVISLGEEVFRDRLKAASFNFQQSAVRAILSPVINVLRRLNAGSLAANLFILLQAHYPIYLTVAKERA
jgi:SAM-dependent methyltransferase